MTTSIMLTSDVPVVLPDGTITITATVKNDDTPVDNVELTWSVYPDGTKTTFTPKTTTDAKGVTTNDFICAVEADLTVTATALVDGVTLTSSFDIGFAAKSLPVPFVVQADNGIIDAKVLTSSVQALITLHTDNPQVGDIYRFYWGPQHDLLRAYDGTNFPWVINVTDSFNPVDVFSDGSYLIYYTITDTSGNKRYSTPVPITVEGGTYGAKYDPPLFPNLKNNTLNYDELINDNGLVIDIPYSKETDIVSGSIINVFMKITQKSGVIIYDTQQVATYTVLDADITNKKIEMLIAANYLSDNKDTFDDVRGIFYYSVTNAGQTGTSFSKTIFIDTTPPHIVKS